MANWKRDSKDSGYITTDETRMVMRIGREWWVYMLNTDGTVGQYLGARKTMREARSLATN